eukprot:gene1551-2825_t
MHWTRSRAPLSPQTSPVGPQTRRHKARPPWNTITTINAEHKWGRGRPLPARTTDLPKKPRDGVVYPGFVSTPARHRLPSVDSASVGSLGRPLFMFVPFLLVLPAIWENQWHQYPCNNPGRNRPDELPTSLFGPNDGDFLQRPLCILQALPPCSPSHLSARTCDVTEPPPARPFPAPAISCGQASPEHWSY